MIKEKYFYHETTKKIIIVFGTLFNNILVKHKDSNSATVSQMIVPVFYGPREKMYYVREDNKRVGVKLPRMSFEITGMMYDSTRKMNTFNAIQSCQDETGRKQWTYQPVPWNINITLSLWTRLTEEGLQIIEQILPYFTPDLTIPINEMAQLNIIRDVPFILNSVSPVQEYESEEESGHKKFLWTLDFTVKAYYYTSVDKSEIIKRAVTQLYDSPNATLQNPASNTLSTASERITFTIDPFEAGPNDEYDIIQENLSKV